MSYLEESREQVQSSVFACVVSGIDQRYDSAERGGNWYKPSDHGHGRDWDKPRAVATGNWDKSGTAATGNWHEPRAIAAWNWHQSGAATAGHDDRHEPGAIATRNWHQSGAIASGDEDEASAD